jgi:hypothetical protein
MTKEVALGGSELQSCTTTFCGLYCVVFAPYGILRVIILVIYIKKGEGERGKQEGRGGKKGEEGREKGEEGREKGEERERGRRRGEGEREEMKYLKVQCLSMSSFNVLWILVVTNDVAKQSCADK